MSEAEVTTKTQAPSNVGQKYVVAIGASAGGLEAIHEFFDHMPNNSSLAFVVIQHLSSDYKSLLVELVSKHTHMKVLEAKHDMSIQPDCVYIIPNNKLMTIKENRLRLADKVHDKSPNTAIDTFLVTLAQEKKEKAIAIILSGTGTDGTKGIEAIKEAGGMVIVQDPATAKFDGMPNSAITSGNADFILPPAQMQDELFNYIKQKPVNVLNKGKIDDVLLDEIFSLIYKSTGQEFNLYKTPTIIRRIARRMTSTGTSTLPEYVGLLKNTPQEVDTLSKDFLIGVTRFFRDRPAFEFLEKQIIPELVDSKEDGETLKVWICACSTGEEAYSVAILIYDYLQKVRKQLEVKIFATDIDPSSIDIASKNTYTASAVKDVDPVLLEKYFIRDGKNYSVITPIRKFIVFARHNVTKAPPFIKNDLITCRNMLIYMNNLLQQKVLSTFHFSLNPGGYLFLGSSESASVLKDGMQEMNSKWKFYKKTGSVNYATHNTYITGNGKTDHATEKIKSLLKPGNKPIKTIADDVNDLMIDEFGCVGIYIDKSYEIKETVGNFRKYLSLPERKLDLNLLNMVPKEISSILNTAIRKAWKENKKVSLKRIRINNGKKDLLINMYVKPADAQSAKAYTLILLHESGIEAGGDKEHPADNLIDNIQQNEYIMELEAELNETRNHLQMAVEEMDTTNEELQSSNEELLSANEELQSSNEELQSLNEELHTLNTEHQLKIKELMELNDDLDNYFKSTDIGQVFLDNSMTIRKFNPASVKMINLIEADIGRPVSHISHNIQAENMIQDITSVLHSGNVVEKEVQLKSGTRCLMRIMPYIRKDKQKDGVVISFVDISVITELNNIIAGVFNASTSAILAFKSVRSKDGVLSNFRCVAANNAAGKFLHREADDLTNLLINPDLPQLLENDFFEKYVRVVETGNNFQAEYQTRNNLWYQIIAVKMADGFVSTIADVTERKNAEQKLRRNYNELITARENLKKLNEELEDKVQERTRRLSESEERFNLVSKATNDTIWDWDLVNNQMWHSDNFTSMFGYHRNEETESIGFWFDKIHPEDRKRVESSIYDAINHNKKQWSAEYRFLKADGQYAVILDRGSILHDEFNTPYRMVGSIVDVTRLIEAEKKMNSSENRFRKVFESNMIGMVFSDLKGQVIDANDAFLQMVGYDQSDLQSRSIRWDKITPPEFQNTNQWAVQQLKQKGVCPPFEKDYYRKDGSRVSVLMGAARLDDDKAEAVTYIINITAQKETERRRKELQRLIKKQQDEFYSIFLNAPALITIRRGKELRYEFGNKSFEEFLGHNDYLGKTVAQVNPETFGDKLKEIDSYVLKTGKTYAGKAFRITRRDPFTNEQIHSWFDFIFTPVFTDNAEVDGIAFFGFDVTDLLKAQEATKQLMQKKDEFMSIASHELKTPITSLKGSLQIMQRMASKNVDVKNVYPFIDKADKQTARLTALVEDLLDVTRIQAGKMMFNLAWFNASEAIRECVEDTAANVTSHKIIIEGSADINVYADRPRLEQVLSNFLSNAIKYSPNADKIIVKNEVLADNKLKVSVQDFGIGIPGDKKDFVFDRFFRVQESSHKFSGLGLGLYISAEIIKRHHGEIGVESEENKGSTFWFTIPVTKK